MFSLEISALKCVIPWSGPVGEAFEQQRPQPAALPGVDHRDRHLGHVRLVLEADEARRPHTLPLAWRGAEGLVPVAVDVGQVGELAGAERRLGVMKRSRLDSKPSCSKASAQHRRVARAKAPDVHLGAVLAASR